MCGSPSSRPRWDESPDAVCAPSAKLPPTTRPRPTACVTHRTRRQLTRSQESRRLGPVEATSSGSNPTAPPHQPTTPHLVRPVIKVAPPPRPRPPPFSSPPRNTRSSIAQNTSQQRRPAEILPYHGDGGVRPRVLAVRRPAAPPDGQLLRPLPRRLHLVPRRQQRPPRPQRRPLPPLPGARQQQQRRQDERQPQRARPHRLRQARLRRHHHQQGRPLQQRQPPRRRQALRQRQRRVRRQAQQRHQQQQRLRAQQDGCRRRGLWRLQRRQRGGEELLQQVHRQAGQQQQQQQQLQRLRRQEGRRGRQEEARQERARGQQPRRRVGEAVQDAAGVRGAAPERAHRRLHLRLQQRHHGGEPQEAALRVAVQIQRFSEGDQAGAAPLPLQLLHPPAPRHLRGCELWRSEHRPGGVGGQEVQRRVPLPCTGEGGHKEDLRPAGGGRLPPDPAPLRRAQVPAGAQHHRGSLPPRYI